MYKQIGAILLVAGTCIGSGMIALPMVLASLGLIPSILLMGGIWFIMYYTSLVNLELNLQAGRGLTLGTLGRYFSGKTAEFVGTISLKLLSYSLLAVFIYGGSSILQELIASKLAIQYSFGTIATWYALISIALLLLPIKFIDYFNRFLFTGLLAVVAILLTGLVITINWSELPIFTEQYRNPLVWAVLIPGSIYILWISSHFPYFNQLLQKRCRNAQAGIFMGTILTIIYIIWTCSILSVVYQNNPQFYDQMRAGKAEVGELIQVLSGIAKWQSVQLLVWWISSLAIATSVLGVGVGLCDSFKGMLSEKIHNSKVSAVLASVIAILPAYLVALYVPNAFIAVLGFAGMILAVIAILLPVYLFRQIKKKDFTIQN